MASKSVVVTGGTSVGGGSRGRGILTGSARPRSGGMGTIGTDETTDAGGITTDAGGHGREIRGGVITRRKDGLGAPPDPKPQSTAGGAVPAAAAVCRHARVEMRPEGGKAFPGAGLQGGEGADATESVITVESSSCRVLVERGARWATTVAAAGASGEPLSPLERTTKTEAKAGLAGRSENPPSQGGNGRWRLKQMHERRTSPEEQKCRQSSYMARVCDNRENPRR